MNTEILQMGFAEIPKTHTYQLLDARCSKSILSTDGLPYSDLDYVRCNMIISHGKIADISDHQTPPHTISIPSVNLNGGIILPRLIDIHTHLDKGHIWQRSANPDGSFMGALTSVAEDRNKFWSAEDVTFRMDYALRCAYVYGTAAIRTHLDSIGPQTAISWPVFDKMRAQWAGRIHLQAVAIYAIDMALDQPDSFEDMVATVARYNGILGGVTHLGEPFIQRTSAALDRVFHLAERYRLDLDFHVDETDAHDATTLEIIADTALKRGFKGKILAGHCCSLSLLSDTDLQRIIRKLVEANISVVSLPMCNMYLQDRKSHITPRWRGVAPVHELAQAGVPVMIASDNTRDPFYAYGDLDLIEVAREATRILHLDHSGPDWLEMVSKTPANQMALASGQIRIGAPADLILTRARTQTEFFSRPQHDRTVLVEGRAIDRQLPDYRELDYILQ